MNTRIKNIIKDYTLITIGAFLIALAFASFIIPMGISAGGASGMAVILNIATQIPVVTLVAIINIVLLTISFFVLDRTVFYRSIYGTLIFPVFLKIIPNVNPLTDTDALSTVIFASISMGIGFMIVFKYRGSTGGTSIFPYFIKKFFGLPMAVGFFLTDLTVVSLNLIFKQIDGFFYGLLFIMISNILVNFSQTQILKQLKVDIYTDEKIKIQEKINEFYNESVTKYIKLNDKEQGKLSLVMLASDFKKIKDDLKENIDDIKIITTVVKMPDVYLDERYKN